MVRAEKAEGSDEHIGLDHRGARRFRAVRCEPESSRWRSEEILEVAGCPWDMRLVGRTSPRDAFSRAAELLAAEAPQPDDDWTDIERIQSQPAGARCTSSMRW